MRMLQLSWILALCGSAAAQTPISAASVTASSDWIIAEPGALAFCGGDFDADGFGDVLMINARRELCVSYGMRGWKATPWKVLAPDMPADALGMGMARHTDPGLQDLVVGRPHALVRYTINRGKIEKVLEQPFPVRTISALFSIQGMLWLQTDKGDHYMQRVGTHEFDGPRPKPQRRNPLPIAPPSFGCDQPKALFTCSSDLNGDSIVDELAVFACKEPFEHWMLRAALTANPQSGDADADGLPDARELELHTDPLDRDSDDDGLLDGWEAGELPFGFMRDAPLELDPLKPDVIVCLTPSAKLGRVGLAAEVREAESELVALAQRFDPPQALAVHLELGPSAEEGVDARAAALELPHEGRGLVRWLFVSNVDPGVAHERGDVGESAGEAEPLVSAVHGLFFSSALLRKWAEAEPKRELDRALYLWGIRTSILTMQR